MPADLPPVTAAGILLMTGPDATARQFLLMRHVDRWDLPKGHAEPGETPRETALRETEEETGIAGSRILLDPHFQFSLRYPVRYREHGDRLFDKTVHYFLGHVDRVDNVRCSEHVGCRWFDWSPPHRIQSQTIDPLLAAVEKHLAAQRR